jgi:hypothetical protein
MKYHSSCASRQQQSRWLIRYLSVATLVFACCFTGPAQAQQSESTSGIQLVAPAKQRWEIGVIIQSPGTCTGITAAVTVPKSWPEQAVKIIDQQKSSHVRSIRFQTLSNDVTRMVISIPRLSAGSEARVMVTYEVIKSHIAAPTKTESFRAAAQPSRSLQRYLIPSPFIESRDPKIRALSEQIVTDQGSDWEKVEAIYDWVRENIHYKFDPQLRGALTALQNKQGDCEEMTSLFIALCRINKIPARSVWIPGHCYPEFYLEDQSGKGHWFPCQAAGTRAFGSMPDYRPILQKGDSFRLPGQRTPQRYVTDTLQARNATLNPQVKFIRRQLDGNSAAP